MKNIPTNDPVKIIDMDNLVLLFPWGMEFSEAIMHDKGNS